MNPDPMMPMPMSDPMDDDLGVPGRSKETDAEALRAAKESKIDRGFKVVPEDMQGGSAGEEPQGNR